MNACTFSLDVCFLCKVKLSSGSWRNIFGKHRSLNNRRRKDDTTKSDNALDSRHLTYKIVNSDRIALCTFPEFTLHTGMHMHVGISI